MGTIEKISDQPYQSNDSSIHHLSHYTVISTDKQTTKLRTVYNASTKDKGPSLNDCLSLGLIYQNILHIFLRLCTYKIALTADIEKAFLMVSIHEADSDGINS